MWVHGHAQREKPINDDGVGRHAEGEDDQRDKASELHEVPCALLGLGLGSAHARRSHADAAASRELETAGALAAGNALCGALVFLGQPGETYAERGQCEEHHHEPAHDTRFAFRRGLELGHVRMIGLGAWRSTVDPPWRLGLR